MHQTRVSFRLRLTMQPFAWIVFAVTAAAVGCSRGRIDPVELAETEQAFDHAKEAFQQARFEEAVSHFSTAIDQSGLNSETLCEALVYRTLCFVELERFEDALADLGEAEQAIPDMGLWHFARAKLFQAQGDSSKAAAEMREAQSINPSLTFEVEYCRPFAR